MKPSFKFCLALAGATVLATDAAEAAGADDFKGRTVTYIVATAPGGAYDGYGRLTARYMEKYLPGSTFVVVNRPGAGHMIGTNMIYAAKPDGFTMGTFNMGVMYSQLVGVKAAQYDLGKMSWIGKASTDPRVLITGTNSEFKTFQDIKHAKRDVKLGASGVGGNNYNESLMVSRTYKLPIKVIPGYTGSENNLGVMRGEIDGFFSGFSSVEPLVKGGRAQYIMQFGNDIANVPNALDLAESEDAKAVARLLNSQSELGRLTAGPPEIPADRLTVLRAAYRGVMESQAFLAEASKLDLPAVPMYGDDIRNRVVEALAQPPAVRDLLKEITAVKAE